MKLFVETLSATNHKFATAFDGEQFTLQRAAKGVLGMRCGASWRTPLSSTPYTTSPGRPSGAGFQPRWCIHFATGNWVRHLGTVYNCPWGNLCTTWAGDLLRRGLPGGVVYPSHDQSHSSSKPWSKLRSRQSHNPALRLISVFRFELINHFQIWNFRCVPEFTDFFLNFSPGRSEGFPVFQSSSRGALRRPPQRPPRRPLGGKKLLTTRIY